MPRQPEHPDLDDVRLDRLFFALGDRARLRIVSVLCDRAEHSREEFDVAVGPSTLSHHMKILREAGLTRHRYEGTHCRISLRADTLARFPAALQGALEALAAERHEEA
ncbi:helix-turn-helix transcriptional regulator [Streptomyces sp. NPDC023723]|uniref:ArsR/SmtB family transcription factor n=1 Tax=Streptomyces sp. NPDC023723 TaxID=3154323 RepID=UPI0033D8DC26